MRQMRSGMSAGYRTYPITRADKSELTVSLDDIRKLCFALRETALYLNNHPCDADALAYFRKTACMLDAAKAEYESTVGPITWNVSEDCEAWSWVASPWPWEI
ncbi:MAG: spore coat protein CotJB [Clostridia bacterium]|nr:spore coat protein CotJB [Clostridia bacterium]